ncbi:MAG: sodium ion-translocating decarboxylase subunit beta [SAR324 cluster bacterium]|nr:sodium ion-translocating decarboxylase subunit beta [SAR324 cluster bacterium]
MVRFLSLFFSLLVFCFPMAFADELVQIASPDTGIVVHVEARAGNYLYSGDEIATIKDQAGNKIILRSGVAGKLIELTIHPFDKVQKGDQLGAIDASSIIADRQEQGFTNELPPMGQLAKNLFKTTGISSLVSGQSLDWTEGLGRLLMVGVGLLLLYLGIHKQFEPLLLVPIGFGAVLTNIPLAGLSETGGMLKYISDVGISTGVFPLLIFMGVGALTDFGPMIANPKTALLGGAAQMGIFCTLLGALALNGIPGINFSLRDAASIGIIGGADGPTAIFLSSQLSPRLLGSIAVAAYSYMALVPIIQPPIMRLLTTEAERKIQMVQMRYVSRLEKILFPFLVVGLCLLFLPSAAPLIGMLMFGNLLRESGVVERLSTTAQNSLINTVTIFLGLGVGSKLSADKFLNIETLGILILGMIAFSIGTATGVLMAKLMNKMSSTPINPLIGAAGVSAVPMAARVVNKVGLENNSHNFLLMHAMGPNVSGVIGSAVAAGVLLGVL